jgi:DNA-binding IclR family transcriptional regulator
MTTQKKTTSKAAMVIKILAREKGATLLEMSKATGWQPHSCRAFLTGLRKKGSILKEERSDGQLAYRIAPVIDHPSRSTLRAPNE